MPKDKYPCIFLKPNEGYCVYNPSNIFTQGRIFGRPFLEAFKRQSNSVGAQLFVYSKCLDLIILTIYSR